MGTAVQRALLIQLIVAAIIFSQQSLLADDVSVESVRSAWDRRRALLRSFEYKCKLEEERIVPLDEGRPDNPFGGSVDDGKPKIAPTLRTDMTFAVSGDKMALTVTGDWWSYDTAATVPREFRVVFDGMQNRQLLSGGSIAFGEFNEQPKPSGHLVVGVNQTPIWLASDPEKHLELYGCDLNKFQIHKESANYEGHVCVVLSFARSRHWFGLIYVDPARDYVPIFFNDAYDGVIQGEVAIEYAPHKTCGYVVARWKKKQFHLSGRIENSVKGEVIGCKINESIPDSTFKLDFPVGAHILKREGDKRTYFVQLPGGKLRQVPESEHGLQPGTKPARIKR